MSRPKKENLDYFPFDVSFFTDRKIRALKGRFGSDGVLVYLYLLCEIYGNYGYYTVLDEDLILCMSDDLGLEENLTRQIVAFLLSRSLLQRLDNKLAKSDTAVSAKSIQRRYQEAKKGAKRDVSVEAERWLLEKSETLSFIKVYPKNGFSEKNDGKSEKNHDKTDINHTKERKGKESKAKDRKEETKPYGTHGNVRLTDSEYAVLVGKSSSSVVEKYIEKMDSWSDKNGKAIKNAFERISQWLEKDYGEHQGGSNSDSERQDGTLTNWQKNAIGFNPNELGFGESDRDIEIKYSEVL